MMRKGMLALLVACAAGCSDPEPAPQPTTAELAPGEMTLSVELRSNGGLAQVFVELRDELSALALGGEDALFFSPVGGEEQRLVQFGDQYIGQTATNVTDFEVVLARGGERFTGAATLPAPFALSAPLGPVSRAQPITVMWDDLADTYDTRLEVGGECLQYRITRVFETDPGTYDVQPADLAVNAGTLGCELTVEVTRSDEQGNIAPDFAPDSAARTAQIRTIAIPTEP
ncbi:hypothetical protein [Polyangium aurulentum]|uniref:hypothetical protein n=1 Tax=Polyangium aurulentum TaxID=2567896 RepID=UPI0010AEC7DB|nr:hypothetical protein [Polyangium aurulentum]UQA62242.1 hypothetical protein E8A73_017930 [Polyangium aurulentum]